MKEDNTIQQIGDVLNKTNVLEMRIGDALKLCIKPVNKEYGFLIGAALNNSVISFGSKIFLLNQLIEYWDWQDLKHDLEKLHEVMSIRNSFAHTCTAMHQLHVDPETHEVSKNESIINQKKGRRFKNKNRDEQYKIFLGLYNSSLTFIDELEKKIKETLELSD